MATVNAVARKNLFIIFSPFSSGIDVGMSLIPGQKKSSGSTTRGFSWLLHFRNCCDGRRFSGEPTRDYGRTSILRRRSRACLILSGCPARIRSALEVQARPIAASLFWSAANPLLSGLLLSSASRGECSTRND